MNDAWDTFSRYGLLRATDSPASLRGTTSIDEFLRDQFVPVIAHAVEADNGLERLARATSS